MDEVRVHISGEDPVTVAVIKRLLSFVSPRFQVISNIPARGGQVKSKVPQCNALALNTPVIMLLDVDNGCAPALKRTLFDGLDKSPDFLFNVSVDEAEAWLMADRQGFAEYFGLSLESIPEAALIKQGGRTARLEMNFDYKSSLYFTHTLAPASNKQIIREQVGVIDPKGPNKGKEYNNAVVPFIQNVWNIDTAMHNSDSLQRMIRRLNNLLESKTKI